MINNFSEHSGHIVRAKALKPFKDSYPKWESPYICELDWPYANKQHYGSKLAFWIESQDGHIGPFASWKEAKINQKLFSERSEP